MAHEQQWQAQRANVADGWRGGLRLALEVVMAAVVVATVMALAVVAVAAQAATPLAAPALAEPVHATPVAVQRAALLLTADAIPGNPEAPASLAAPLVETHISVSVAGLVARTTVTQRYVNPTAQWRDGLYVFPLPDKAAVDTLHMQVGERVIEGQVQERRAAQTTYEQARREGRKASLVSEERPNLFTTRFAQLGPHEALVVTLEYQETLAFDSGSFRLRVPLAITPRYLPASSLAGNHDNPTVADLEDPDGSELAAQVADALAITPPVLAPGLPAINPVTLHVTINAGFALSAISSAYHAVDVSESIGHRYDVTLKDGPVPADRDFELTWTPDVGAVPGAALFTETRNGRTYALLMVLPPSIRTDVQRMPREAVFIVDTSGSMSGVSISQAREAVLFALDRLQAGDLFNVIEFNSVTHALFLRPVAADAVAVERARRFVRGLAARGGTEMKPALELALSAPPAPGHVQQVVFLTDGAVGNEGELLGLIASSIGTRRLFTVGIGPGPNAYFLRKAAQFGRGTATFIGDVGDVKERMTALYAKLERPALTGIDATWSGPAQMYPARVPDLYEGEPIVVTAAFDTPAVTLSLTGARGGHAFGALLPLSAGAPAQGIAALWARERISSLSDAMTGGADEADVKPLILATALEHHLISKYTSLVAVDVTPTAPAGDGSIATAMPVNLPAGLDYAAIYGALPRTATPAPLLFAIAALTLSGAALLWGFARRPRRHAGTLLHHRVALAGWVC